MRTMIILQVDEDKEDIMSEIRYTLKAGQMPTEDQINEVIEASKSPIVADDDCPLVDPEKTPKRYAAMMKAVAERNRRISEKLA